MNDFPAKPTDKEVVVAAVGRGIEEDWIRTTLDAEGIPHRVDGLSEVFGIPRVRIWVRKSDEDRARAALETARQPTDSADEDREEGEEDDRDSREYWRARRNRFLRGTVILAGAWYLVVGLLQWSAGTRLEGGIAVLVGVGFLVLWRRSIRSPARAFAGAAVLGTALFLLLVAGSILESDDPAPLGEVLGHALFVVYLYWGAKGAEGGSSK